VKNTVKTVLIATGGTGGHVFPGIAVAHALKERGIKIYWLGTQYGLDRQLVPQAKIPFIPINIRGLRGKSKWSLLLAPYKIFLAFLRSLWMIKRIKADVVLGMGGYVSGPAGIAAWILRKPLYIHEQNAVPGMTNRYLSKLATATLSAFPNAFPDTVKPIITGNPIRNEIAHLPIAESREFSSARPLRLLVLGGSQGAVTINRLIPHLRQRFTDAQLNIWHQTGAKDFEKTKSNYHASHATIGEALQVTPFLNDMSEVYTWADVVICRAGALTVSEVAAAGLPSILIPFPYATDDHQTCNAEYLANSNGAILIQERDLTFPSLMKLVAGFIEDRTRLKAMAMAARQLAKTDATELVVNAILG
jgi:UDP-N-acetylglucosamine--N-acetylmuramyl-(pentapeptide) pyrophosphoryl-undecaprenol N-acetylglucosamine transferase